MNRATIALTALVAIPAVGLVINTVWPTAQPYAVEQSLLLLLALGALATSRSTPGGAVFLYCSLALLPVGAMLERYAELGAGFSALALVPHLGILFMAALTRNYPATLAYGGIAALTSLAYGNIYHDLGQGGALAFGAGLLAFWAARWVESTGVHLCAEIERLRQDTGELGALAQAIQQKQQELGNDAR